MFKWCLKQNWSKWVSSNSFWQSPVQTGRVIVQRVTLGLLGLAAGGVRAQGMPADVASAVSGTEMTTFEAMATARSESLPIEGGAEVGNLLHSDGLWAGVVAVFRGLPWWGGVVLGLLLAGALAWLWRQWQVRNRAWQAELDALGDRTPMAGPSASRKDSRVAGWRLSRFEELPQFWEDTVVMERDDTHDLEDETQSLRARRWGRRASRVPRNRWATTVTPRGI